MRRVSGDSIDVIGVLILTLGLVPLDTATPQPHLTPGAVRPLTLAQVCSTKWGLDRRKVTERMKRQALASYGWRWEDRAQVEVDHLVPRSLAGADDVRNIWPQPWKGAAGARNKDRLENRLSAEVCAGRLSLVAAQDLIRADWLAAYRRFFGEPPVR